MKIIAICGSPRKGNTEWMLCRLLDKLKSAGAETDLLLLRSMDVRRCTGCLICEEGGSERQGVCAVKDDMQQVYPKLFDADGIILGTPVYFYMLSGLLKNFLDRTCPVWTKLEGKYAAGVAVAEESIGQATKDLRVYADCCGMQWLGVVTALAKGPGEVAQDGNVDRKLARLAARIMSMSGSQEISR